MHPYVHCSIVYNNEDLGSSPSDLSSRVGKTAMVCLHNGILLSCKKEENFIPCGSMDGTGEHYAK